VLEGSSLRLNWPSSASGYQLQFNANLSNLTGWQTEQNTPTVVDGSFNLNVQISSGGGFYRLKQL
jgi:hypothetical protein